MSNNYAHVAISLAGIEVKELASEHDDTFKLICQEGWANQSSGNVEAPTGYYWLVEVTADGAEQDFMGTVQSELEKYGQTYIYPDTGWYVVVQDNQGIWFVYEVPSETAARDIYSRLEAEYLAWDDDAEAYT